MTQSWCYYTIFVTQYGLLHAAKRRYHERITEVRQDYDVVLVSEHAYQLSTPPLFAELIASHPEPTCREEEYATFVFTAIITIPNDTNPHMVAHLLELDYTDGSSPTFPSRTSATLVSAAGNRTPDFPYQQLAHDN